MAYYPIKCPYCLKKMGNYDVMFKVDENFVTSIEDEEEEIDEFARKPIRREDRKAGSSSNKAITPVEKVIPLQDMMKYSAILARFPKGEYNHIENYGNKSSSPPYKLAHKDIEDEQRKNDPS